jgi:diacylglycerol kinase family enzyme
VCESNAVRAVALLGPYAKQNHLKPFELPGVNLFSGNDLDPTDQPEAVLIFGGDGTIHRHLSGLAHKQIPTLIVPIGSANDFAQSIGIGSAKQAQVAWQRFCVTGDNVRSIDLGTIEPLQEPASEASLGPAEPAKSSGEKDQDEPWRAESLETLHFVPDGPRHDLPRMGGRIMQSQLRRATEAERELSRTTFFCCIAGTGLDAAVNRQTLRQSHWLRGHGGYVVALVETLGGFKPPRVTVSVETGGMWTNWVNENGFLVAAGNGPQYGHGMRLTHEAQMDDGLLDVCFVRTLSKLRLLRLFRVVYRGRHIGMKEVEYFRAARLRLAADRPMEVFADGEYVCETPVEIGVRPEALRIIVPS